MRNASVGVRLKLLSPYTKYEALHTVILVILYC